MIGPKVLFLLPCRKSSNPNESPSVNTAQATFFICREPRGGHWQLGSLPPETGHMTLIGWRRSPVSPDAGVPQTIATVLARALTAVARVTFPCSTVDSRATDDWSPVADDLGRALGRRGLLGRVQEAVTRAPATILLLSTRRPEAVARLFDDARYPWWLQGQVGLLSAREAAPPDCDRLALTDLLGDDWASRIASLARSGVLGILRPGVDGDLAGLLSFAHAFEESVLIALEKEVRRSGGAWAVLTEDAFSRQLAGGEF